jgi:hypothetical protein
MYSLRKTCNSKKNQSFINTHMDKWICYDDGVCKPYDYKLPRPVSHKWIPHATVYKI